MQILSYSSTEIRKTKGLQLISGDTKKYSHLTILAGIQ